VVSRRQAERLFNCVDRHVDGGDGDKVAYHWEGEPEDERRTITFADL
jgi:acetyl-CoA synthetase